MSRIIILSWEEKGEQKKLYFPKKSPKSHLCRYKVIPLFLDLSLEGSNNNVSAAPSNGSVMCHQKVIGMQFNTSLPLCNQ